MSEASRRAAEEMFACHGCIKRWAAEYGTGLSPTGGWTANCPHVDTAIGRAVAERDAEIARLKTRTWEDAEKLARAVSAIKPAPCPVGHEHSYLCTICAVARAVEGERERIKNAATGWDMLDREKWYRIPEAALRAPGEKA